MLDDDIIDYETNEREATGISTYRQPWESDYDYRRRVKYDQDQAQLDSENSKADNEIAKQNNMIENVKKTSMGIGGGLRYKLNTAKNWLLHAPTMRKLRRQQRINNLFDTADAINAKQHRNSNINNYMMMYPNMMTYPGMTGMTPMMPRYGMIPYGFSEKQKRYWGKILAFSGPTPYSANNPQVQDAIAQANMAQEQANQLRAQAQTVQATPPAPVLYPTQVQPVPQYGGGVYAQPQQYTYQPNLAPGTNQIAVRAQTDPVKKPSILDDAKKFWNSTTDKIGSYLDSKGIDRDKAKKAALIAAMGGLGVTTLGQTLSKRRLQNENDELKARLAELEDKLENRRDYRSRSSRKKKRRDDYYDDDDGDDGANSNQGNKDDDVYDKYGKNQSNNDKRRKRYSKS